MFKVQKVFKLRNDLPDRHYPDFEFGVTDNRVGNLRNFMVDVEVQRYDGSKLLSWAFHCLNGLRWPALPGQEIKVDANDGLQVVVTANSLEGFCLNARLKIEPKPLKTFWFYEIHKVVDNFNTEVSFNAADLAGEQWIATDSLLAKLRQGKVTFPHEAFKLAPEYLRQQILKCHAEGTARSMNPQ